MQQIAERVYIETTYRGGNVGCVITDQGLILVDVPILPREARRWQDQIANLTSRPILYIVNTACCEERIIGNAFFDIPVVTHELAWERLEAYGDSFGQLAANLVRAIDPTAADVDQFRLVKPQITFTERIIFYKGTPEVRLIHLGGHTPANLGVYLFEEQILFAGDNVVLDTLPVLVNADTKQWLQALTTIRKMRVETLVPGYGPPCDTNATQLLSEYLRLVRDQVRRAFQTGRSKSEISSLVSDLVDAYPIAHSEREGLRSRIKANLDRVYDEVKVQQRRK